MTIKDIARISGVGISTVSRVINNSGSVSDETYKKVMNIVNKHQYVPNSSARNLKASTTQNISLLVKGITNPFFHQMIQYIEHAVSLRGYSLIIQDVSDITNELQFAVQERRDKNVCAVILIGGNFGYKEKDFELLGVPCILLTISAALGEQSKLYSSVLIDDELEGFRATEHLIALGHKKIGFICYYPGDENTPNGLRFKGYKNALEKNGIPFDNSLVAKYITSVSPSGYRVGFDAFKQIYTNHKDMTAVFCFSDTLAIGAAKSALTLGLQIPSEISIIGFDGIDEAEFFHPSIDTISQPARDMALSSVSQLFNMLDGAAPQHIVYDCALLKRGSTAKNNF